MSEDERLEERKKVNYEKKGESDFETGSSSDVQYKSESMVLVNGPAKSKKQVQEEEFLAELTENEREMLQKMQAHDAGMQEHRFDFGQIHQDSVAFFELLGEKDPYPAMLSILKEGNFTAECKKRYMIRAIDEHWVDVVEDCMQALDAIIRRPSKFIEQNEELLPIELSKNISSRSIQHLSQHTNLINSIDGDDITPTKLLNVFHDETMQTYENKFVNTLLNRLYIFISKRYDAAAKEGNDQKQTRMNFEGNFSYGSVRGKLNIGFEVSETPEEKVQLNNVLYTSDIWKRVEKIFTIVKGYQVSDFAQAMGKSYIRPPVMHTNAILKNKNLRKCLDLWEFIESYEEVGIEMMVSEDAETISDTYIDELYEAAALQYVNFRYHMKNNNEAEVTVLNSTETKEALRPKFVQDIQPITVDEFDIHETKIEKVYEAPQDREEPSLFDQDIADAIEIAIAADIFIEQERARIAEEKRLAEERRKAEEQRRIETAKMRKDELYRRQLEEKLVDETELERARVEEMQRILEEQARRLQEQEEQARLAEAARLAEEQARLAEEQARLAEEQAKEQAMEKEIAEEVARSRALMNKKKEVHDSASELAELLGLDLPETFDFYTYTEFLENWKKEQKDQRK